MGFVGMQESAVLAGNQRLEGEFAPGGADGLANKESLVPEKQVIRR